MTGPLKTKSLWWAWMLLGAGGCFAATRPDMLIQAAMPIWNFLNNNGSAVIATCALGVTFWQACVMRKHNRLSVKPFLATTEGNDKKGDGGKVSFVIENCGVGPALIKSFALWDEDREVCKNNRKAYEDHVDKIMSGFRDILMSCFVPGFAIPVGSKHTLLEFSYSQGQDISFIHKLNVVVEYQSIYQDEIFTYDSRKDRQFHGREAQDA